MFRSTTRRITSGDIPLDTVGARAVQTQQGMRGVQIRYLRAVGGRPHRYWATLFVRPGGFLRRAKIYIVEAGGDAETFDRAAPQVERTIATLDP